MESKNVVNFDSYIGLFDQIREKTESDCVAIAILQELGKDRRSELIRKARAMVRHRPASEKQKQFMKQLGISFPAEITSKEAYLLLREQLKAVNA